MVLYSPRITYGSSIRLWQLSAVRLVSVPYLPLSRNCVGDPRTMSCSLDCCRKLRQHLTGEIIEDCLTVLMKTHMVLRGEFMLWIWVPLFPLNDRTCQFFCCFLLAAHSWFITIVDGMLIFHLPVHATTVYFFIGRFPRRSDWFWISSNFDSCTDGCL